MPAKADIHFGFFTSGANYLGSQVAAVEALVGKAAILQSFWHAVHHPGLADMQLDQMVANNRTPMVNVQPYGADGGLDVLDAINAGYYDVHFRYWANLCKLVAPDIVLMRFLHEANCCYTWRTFGGDYTRGAKYINAWRRLYSIVHQETDNVMVGWCPNDEGQGNNIDYRFDSTFPGWEWMDFASLDTYWNYGGGWNHVVHDEYTLIEYTINHMNTLGMQASGKPFIVGEWGVYETGPSGVGGVTKAQIVTAVLNDVWTSIPNLIGIVSQDAVDGASDWRFNSSSQSLAAYQAALSGYNTNKLTAADFDLSNLGGSGGSGGAGGTGGTGGTEDPVTGGGTGGGGGAGGETPPVVVNEVLQNQIAQRLGGYDAIWTNPDLIEEYLQNGLGLREQDIRVIMQNIQHLAKNHWHYNPVAEPGTGGYVENARSWHASRFYNSLGWNH